MTLENVSLHCNKEFQSTTAKNIYIYLKLTVDLLLRAMMPFFFFTASRTSLYELWNSYPQGLGTLRLSPFYCLVYLASDGDSLNIWWVPMPWQLSKGLEQCTVSTLVLFPELESSVTFPQDKVRWSQGHKRQLQIEAIHKHDKLSNSTNNKKSRGSDLTCIHAIKTLSMAFELNGLCCRKFSRYSQN